MANYFADIPEITYEGPTSRNPLAFKHYNKDEVILGKPMKDWLRFACCYWHTWRGYGFDIFGTGGTIERPWDLAMKERGADPLETEMMEARERVRVNFAFMEKLGIDYFCFHDRDIAPAGKTLEESNKMLDDIITLIEEHMKKSGKKLLWGTANLFSDKLYMNGAATNPDPLVFARAAAQVKKALEVTNRLNGENYVLWGGREGYSTIYNTNMKLELNNMARFLKMVADYKEKIGFKGTLLIEPKPREPTSHQYDFDAATVIGFLREHNLSDKFKLNLEANHATLAGHTAEHEVTVASDAGMLGSLDANHNESTLGWDTDMFPTDVRMAVIIVRAIIRQGGLGTGGLNFDCKIRRESTDLEDIFIGHINGMDTYARALRIYAKMESDGIWEGMLRERYAGYTDSDTGKTILAGTSLEACEKLVLGEQWALPSRSGKEEKFISILNSYVNST